MFRHIAIEGVIGVGKTTLTDLLAKRLRAEPVYEAFQENPFLSDFYRDPEVYAFSTQMFFLMSRYRQQEKLLQGELFRHRIVSDYMFDKDRIFAFLNLVDEELLLYEQVFDALGTMLPKPDLVIYLEADVDTLKNRIKQRGRAYEQSIEPEYLVRLHGAYRAFFAGYRDSPILTLSTVQLDFRTDTDAFEQLVYAIQNQDLSLFKSRIKPSTQELEPKFAF